ncbi:hypothetical protein A2U01_0042150, partial [Trifolium medium]|nr:hypothetical protein [Trifolium medium]
MEKASASARRLKAAENPPKKRSRKPAVQSKAAKAEHHAEADHHDETAHPVPEDIVDIQG